MPALDDYRQQPPVAVLSVRALAHGPGIPALPAAAGRLVCGVGTPIGIHRWRLERPRRAHRHL